jgi:hypothetical protein
MRTATPSGHACRASAVCASAAASSAPRASANTTKKLSPCVSTVWEREDAQVSFTEAHGDLFRRNQVLWRGEERIAFGVERPQGFCSVTAL